ncbi:MAG: glycosyltransferase family 39 protein [Candidatus Aegiribacteria sp.]|nr:glycosyltransferase family 39 protein [Candidatus Aegiribacteria sp.]
MRKYRRLISENPWLSYLLVFIAGITLRLIQIGSKSLWVDEAYAAGLMGMNPVDLVKLSIAGSPHPPLAFLFIQLSTVVFGQSEVGLRMIPAFASALAAIPLMCFVARRISFRSAFWAGLIWSVSPYAVSMGQEAWLYGVISFLGFLFIDVVDRAWNGSRKALYLVVPIALIGMLVQHMFGLFIAAGFALYFTVPRNQRLPFRQLALVSVIFMVLYAPFAALMLKQTAFRAERMSRAAMDMAAVYRYRFLVRVPTVFVRLIPGGLLLEAGHDMIHDRKQIIFWLFFGAGNLFLLLNLFLRNLLDRKFRIWLFLLFSIPFLIFFKEDPTVRHLTILWIPLGFAVAAASQRWKLSGPVMLAAAAIMLLPYYNISSFPYHRSNWRRAVEFVEERFSGDESILVLGAQSGGLAWDYYSSGILPRTALGGEDPYSEHLVPGRSVQSAVDSLMNLHDSIWVVTDYWGGPRTSDIIGGYRILLETWISPSMEVVHISE